jgi:hypothetical protein
MRQGFAKHGQFGKRKGSGYKLINHLGFPSGRHELCGRKGASPFAIAARVPGYEREWLEELQNEGSIFDSGRLHPDLFP